MPYCFRVQTVFRKYLFVHEDDPIPSVISSQITFVELAHQCSGIFKPLSHGCKIRTICGEVDSSQVNDAMALIVGVKDLLNAYLLA